jgi:hypothetical protein
LNNPQLLSLQEIPCRTIRSPFGSDVNQFNSTLFLSGDAANGEALGEIN